MRLRAISISTVLQSFMEKRTISCEETHSLHDTLFKSQANNCSSQFELSVCAFIRTPKGMNSNLDNRPFKVILPSVALNKMPRNPHAKVPCMQLHLEPGYKWDLDVISTMKVSNLDSWYWKVRTFD